MLDSTIPKMLIVAYLGSLLAFGGPLDRRQGPTPSGVPSIPACCGYEVVNRDSTYFRYKHEINFDQLTTMDPVYMAGWEISHGWQIGPTNNATGQKAIANENNVDIVPGQGLRLKVPRQDKNATSFSSAEIVFPDIVLGAVIEVEMKLTGVSGTAAAFMTTHADNRIPTGPVGWRDQQVMRVMSNTLYKPLGQVQAGINMVNYEATTGKASTSSQLFPSGIDPTADFHKYSISWYPTTSSNNPAKLTEMGFDGQLLRAPALNSAVNPQAIALSHLTNGYSAFSGGPPAEDAYVTIKRVVAYYDKPIRLATGTGVSKDTCKRENACKVTI